MDDILLLDTTERYLKGELGAQEKALFEELRKKDADVDQFVVEHSMFLQQMEALADKRDFKHRLHDIHNKLSKAGEVSEGVESQGKLVFLWNKYKRVTAIAATIAGFTALFISALVIYFTPVPNKHEIVQLNRKIDQVMHNVRVQSNQLNNVLQSKVPVDEVATNGGTSFLVDNKGYLATNAHVIAGASSILVQNRRGEEFKARIVHVDDAKDLAILKIDDKDFKPLGSLPYSIRKGSAELGEQIFTLGYPRDEIVYNEGYMSAKTGFRGDTISCQIAVSANPGNSGGPVFNKNGEVIGMLSTTQIKAQGVVFAIKSRNVHQAIDSLKRIDTAFQRIKVPGVTNIKGMDRVQQVKQIEDCVFMVKSFSK
jgi:S1-C subfamily serine protease